jgi:hypothetical protein
MGRRHRAGTPADETRRYGGDFSHLPPILLESDHPPPPVPEKDLPRIPSTSTGLWDRDVVSVKTDMMGYLTASPIVGCPPPPVPSYHVYERAPITEAQRIAAEYRQRHRSPSDATQSTAVSELTALDVSTERLELSHASPSSAVVQSGVSIDTEAVDAPFGASLAPPQSSPTRQTLAEEINTTAVPHEDTDLFSRVREDGTALCTRGDCLAVLPSLEAFLCHSHIHLIHEEYVVRL